MVNHSALDQWVVGSRLADNVFLHCSIFSTTFAYWSLGWILIIFRSSPKLSCLQPLAKICLSTHICFKISYMCAQMNSGQKITFVFWERVQKKNNLCHDVFSKIKFYNYFYDVLWTLDDQQLCFRFFCRKNRVYPIMLPQIGGEIVCETLWNAL